MRLETLRHEHLRVLVVTCAPLEPDHSFPAFDTFIEYFITTSREIEGALTTSAGFDYVISIFDPTATESAAEMRFVADAVKRARVTFCSVSTLNPEWIENLMNQFGSIQHFRSFPTTQQVLNLRNHLN